MDNIIAIDETGYDLLEKKIKIASFDLDNTLITTKGKHIFPKNKDDWKFLNNNVENKIKNLYNSGFKIVIFSNQNGISKKKITREDLNDKIISIINKLSVPIIFYASIYDDINRKPRIGLWSYMIKNKYPNINISESFYCGDAIGRKGDFASSDFKFSLNIGIKFISPEELFNNLVNITDYNQIKKSFFNINDYIKSIKSIKLNNLLKKNTKREILLLIGPPASGKTTLAKTLFSNYKYINQDELKTLNNCKKEVITFINKNKNKNKDIIIDNTNRNIKTRKIWIEIAKKNNFQIRCIDINIPKEFSIHINTYRKLIKQQYVPDIAIHSFYKNYELPKIEEGFIEIISIPFLINQIKIKTNNIFYMYLN
jgi:bifunctional polynucleotide phosphatase/kinase